MKYNLERKGVLARVQIYILHMRFLWAIFSLEEGDDRNAITGCVCARAPTRAILYNLTKVVSVLPPFLNI
jgi:hypothetical protein